MKQLIVPSLGACPIIPSGIYSHVNDRYITSHILKCIHDKVSIGRRHSLNINTPIADIVGVLSGYECVYEAKGAGGYCDSENKVIAIDIKYDRVLPNICHEISHSIQADMGMFNDFSKMLSQQVKIEHQCETMAYYLYNGLFPEAPIPWYQFASYFNQWSILWLADWYKGYVENDLIIKS